MSEDEQNNSNEKPAGGAKRRKPFTRMIDVSDQFMYETFEVGADLSGDELQIQPSNMAARPEEPPEPVGSGAGLSSLLGSGAHDHQTGEEPESPQVTTFSSLLQATGEFVRPTKTEKQPLDGQSFSPPPAFGLPPTPQQPAAPPYRPQPGQSPLPVLPKYVPTQKNAPTQPPPAPQPQTPAQPKSVQPALPQKPVSPANPPTPSPRVASSLTPGLGFDVPANPFESGRLTDSEASQSQQGMPAQTPAASFSHQNLPAQQSDQPQFRMPATEIPPLREESLSPAVELPPAQGPVHAFEPPQPPAPAHSGRPPEPPAKPSGLMGSLQSKGGPGFGRSQSPFAPPAGESIQSQFGQPAPAAPESPTDLDDLIFNSDEPSEPPTSYQTTLSARHRTVRRADFTRPRIPQLDPQDSDVVAASQSPMAEPLQIKSSRPGRPKPKRTFLKKLSEFFGQIGSAFCKLFKDED